MSALLYRHTNPGYGPVSGSSVWGQELRSQQRGCQARLHLRGGPAQGCPYLVVVRSGEQEVVEGVALVGIITAVVAEVTTGVGVEWADH